MRGIPAALLVLALCGCSHAQSRASRHNEALFHELRAYAGARVVTNDTTPYYEEDAADPAGYSTRIELQAPAAATPAAVARFYAGTLQAKGWGCRRWSERVPRGTFVFLDCRRGRASLSLNTDNMYARPPRFELGIDARRFPEA